MIEDVSFTAESGELLTILGSNGCGKSTLIKTMCNVMKPKAGTITIDGEGTTTMDGKELAKKLAYVP